MISIKCEKCSYEWITRSKLYFVSCPSCNKKVRNEAGKFIDGDSFEKVD